MAKHDGKLHDKSKHVPPPVRHVPADAPHEPEGATDKQVGDLTGPGAGYDDEPEQVKDKGGVA